VVFSAFGGVTEQLIGLSNLAKSGDLSYKDALLALEERHLSMANALLGIEKSEKVEAFIRQRFHELEDLNHGIYLIKEQSPRTLDYVASFGERLYLHSGRSISG
jgi:aspartokinase/homoserine dehydrogenase 1